MSQFSQFIIRTKFTLVKTVLIVNIVTLLQEFLKTLGIPSLNVCMNCHKNIAEFQGSKDSTYVEYTKEFYTGEIQKLYDAVGWDKAAQKYTGKTKPVKWVRIHNLPDFVYFQSLSTRNCWWY